MLCENIGQHICKNTLNTKACEMLTPGLVSACKASASVGHASCTAAIELGVDFMRSDLACKAAHAGVYPSVQAMAGSVGLPSLAEPVMTVFDKACANVQHNALDKMGDVTKMSPDEICSFMEKEVVYAATSAVAQKFAAGIQQRVEDSVRSVKEEANRAVDQIMKGSNEVKKAVGEMFGAA